MSTLPPIDIPGTLPEDWIQLVSMIQTMLPDTVDVSQLVITSNGELVNYLTGEKWTPIYTIQEVITGWAQVGGANPADTTAVSVRPITDIVAVTGGSAVKDIVSGKGAFGMVKKGVILGSLMALFVSTLTPATSLEQVKEDLLFTLTPFTVDGENIPVYIDENGLTHVSETVMNAVREKLIELGVYDSEGSITPTVEAGDVLTNVTSSRDKIIALIDEAITYYSNPDSPKPSYSNDRYGYISALETLKANIPELQTGYVYVLSKEAGGSGNNKHWYQVLQIPASGLNGKTVQGNGGSIENFYPSTNQMYVQTSSSETPPYATCVRAGWAGYHVENPTIILDTAYTSPVLSRSSTSRIGGCTLVGGGASNAYSVYAIGFDVVPGGGVDGLDVTGKSDFGDLSKTLEDAVQGLANRYITIANPIDDDIFNKDKWYELNLNSDDVWTDGLDADQTDPVTNTQGESDDDTKDEIIEKLLEIIQDITGNPDLPDIPAGDTGDTPPAEPPVLDGSSNGLWTIYNPTKQEVQDFGAWLWSANIIDQIVRQFNSPIDAIIGFHQIYCTPETGSAKIIKAGYLDSPVSALEVTDQYAEINCGEVSVNEYYGNAMDYDNTQVSIYLPFVGIVPLDTNIVMGSSLEVIYRIDVFTGTCLAQVKVKKQNSNAVMYAFEGNCAVQIPLTATTYTGMIGALISGISAGVSFAGGDMLHAVTSGASAVMSALGGRSGAKQSGTMGSNAGALGIRKPYLIITRNASAMPAGFETLSGLPSTELTALSSVSGFTVVRNVHLEGIPGTAEELEEIKSLLESGVIF